MSEKNKPEVPELDLRPSFPNGSPNKPVEYSAAKTREAARHRAIALDREAVAQSKQAIAMLADLLQNISQTPLSPAVDKVVTNPENIQKVIDVQVLIGEVVSKLQFILNIFSSAKLNIDAETGRPSVTDENLGIIEMNLAHARKHLEQVSPKGLRLKEEQALPSPDSHVVQLLNIVQHNPAFLNNPDLMLKVYRILNNYFESFIQATHLSIAGRVAETSSRVAELQETNQMIAVQKAQEEMLYDEVSDETKKQLWNMLMEIELTFGRLFVALKERQGPQADALLKQIPRKVLSGMLKDLQIRQETAALAPNSQDMQESGILSGLKKGIGRFLGIGETPSTPPSSRSSVPPSRLSSPSSRPSLPIARASVPGTIDDQRTKLLAVLKRKDKLND